MITQGKVRLTTQADIRITPDFAYSLYGVWMNLLPQNQAGYLHESRAMNQYIVPTGKNTAVLTINLLTDEATHYMSPLLENTQDYRLNKYNCTLTAQEPVFCEYTEDDLMSKYFTSPCIRKHVTLNLAVPTTFKTNNHYAVFPTVELMIRSAVTKWNTLGLSISVDDEKAVFQLIESIMITGYRLASTHYSLKDTHIQSFTGNLTLSIHGAEPMTRLFNMLIGALRFTGLGIKTSLGMGGVII